MAKFHPDFDLLTEYAAGSLPLAQSAVISVHVDQCAHCRRLTSQLTDVGANLMEALQPVAVGDDLLNAVLARLDEEPPLQYERQVADRSKTPAILQRLMRGDFSDLTWKNIGSALRISHLSTGDPHHEFALYHIRAGGRIPEHTHRGGEMTLVLEGGFSDAEGSYHAGDFIYRKPGDVHAPTALQSEDCICLAVVDAPLKFTDWRFRWMNPFLRLRAS
ncbi:MAG: ChrR family anti-sigma-E factor [Halioglobus sp.]|nr:ChrR family anti-sigma-E factor [Halioglobus sp.]